MDTHFLESFVTVAELGSIAEAARKLGLTASAVSQRIRALEQEMNITLVVRSGRTVVPTPPGAALLPEAKKALLAINNLRLLAADGAAWGEFKIGVFTSALTGLLPQILEKLVPELPTVDFHIIRAASVDLYALVLEGRVDAAFVLNPSFVLPKSLEWLQLRKEPLIAITPAHVTETDIHQLLADHSFIRYDRNNWGGRLASRYLDDHGLKPRERLELDSLEAITIMVSRGLGVSIIPDWPPPWPEGVRLNKIVLDDRDYARDLGLLWPRASPKIVIIDALLEHARSACAALPSR